MSIEYLIQTGLCQVRRRYYMQKICSPDACQLLCKKMVLDWITQAGPIINSFHSDSFCFLDSACSWSQWTPCDTTCGRIRTTTTMRVFICAKILQQDGATCSHFPETESQVCPAYPLGCSRKSMHFLFIQQANKKNISTSKFEFLNGDKHFWTRV